MAIVPDLAGVYEAMASRNLYGVELQFGLVDCMSRQYTWAWKYGEEGTNMYKIARNYDYYNSALRPTIDNIWKMDITWWLMRII